MKKKFCFFNEPRGLFHLLRNIHEPILGAKWYQNRRMVKRSFPVISGKLVMDAAPDTLLLNFDIFILIIVLFSYLNLLQICHGKNVKIIFQNPSTHLKRQIHVSRGNFGMDGFLSKYCIVLSKLDAVRKKENSCHIWFQQASTDEVVIARYLVHYWQIFSLFLIFLLHLISYK